MAFRRCYLGEISPCFYSGERLLAVISAEAGICFGFSFDVGR